MSLEVLKHFESGDQLAKQVAKDLAERVLTLLDYKPVHVVLTGGGVGIKTLSELAPLLEDKNLEDLHFWWGDERFVERQSQERNYVQAHQALLGAIQIPAENIHQMPWKNGQSLNEAAAGFASALESSTPDFDLVLLGMGADGHVASLFPDSNCQSHGSLIIAESNSPKPPAERISFSFEALSSAREVWFLVAGAEKAAVVSEVFVDKKLPAALVTGRELTRWYLDTAAAKKLTF
jgi:6-phosphogluconolactonase